MRYINFDNLTVDPEWSFEGYRSVEQWTHGYHRYPAKFLPNVVKKLIETYVTNGSYVVADLFAGCGTTLVEAKVHGLTSVGTDINPVATLIAKVKTTAISPELLQREYFRLCRIIERYDLEKKNLGYPSHPRIDYWFRPEEKTKIAFLFKIINEIEDISVREFFLVCVSHILKNSSIWLQDSTKPQRDLNKKIVDPFTSFAKHYKKMKQGNDQFYNELRANKRLDTSCQIKLEDARNTSIKKSSIHAIITSPPYVTSYEYADIHQLTGYWLDYITNIDEFRQKFIGTSYPSIDRPNSLGSSRLAKKIVSQLREKDKRIARNVSYYFHDLDSVTQEMNRILVPKGFVCIVVGNTVFKDIHIRSAEVIWEYLRDKNFKKVQIIKRNIPHKLMPTIRDKVTGKFCSRKSGNYKEVYPDEFIIIAQKRS